MQSKASRSHGVRQVVGIGLGLFTVGATGLGPVQAKAEAGENVVTNSMGSLLGTIPWAAEPSGSFLVSEKGHFKFLYPPLWRRS